jgi:DNA invertase Pin-like site-specific DNA recombinase
LHAEGCARIYREKASGAQPSRRELLRMLKALGPGDVVTVTRIDRLARSTFDLFAIVKQIVDAGAQFQSLAELHVIYPESEKIRRGSGQGASDLTHCAAWLGRFSRPRTVRTCFG